MSSDDVRIAMAFLAGMILFVLYRVSSQGNQLKKVEDELKQDHDWTDWSPDQYRLLQIAKNEHIAVQIRYCKSCSLVQWRIAGIGSECKEAGDKVYEYLKAKERKENETKAGLFARMFNALKRTVQWMRRS